MEIREPDTVDGDAVRDVAGRSLRASYALSPDAIEVLVADRQSDERLRELAGMERGVLVVAERDDGVVGFAQGAVDDEGHGNVRWHHVAPEARGEGIGTELFEHVESALLDRGAETVRAHVLGDNMEGAQFFERFGYAEAGTTEVVIDGTTHAVNLFLQESETDADPGDERTEPTNVPETVEDEGETLYVDRETGIPGDKGPFFELYSDGGRESLYAYWCSHSESVVAAGDDLGRLECPDCGNVHRADEWDDAYL